MKLRLLEDFARAGPVDAVAFGSSIADQGFSAKAFSAAMSDGLGRQYRVFNFGTGGADLDAIRMLLPLVQTVVSPKTVILVGSPDFRGSENIVVSSPSWVMSRAPIGASYEGKGLPLLASRLVWSTPPFLYAEPIRDLALYGRFEHFKQGGVDLYSMNEYGDSISYTVRSNKLSFDDRRRIDTAVQQDFLRKLNRVPRSERLQVFFSDRQIEAMDAIKESASWGGANLIVAEIQPAASYVNDPLDDIYYEGGAQQLSVAAEHLGAKVLLLDKSTRLPDFAVSDTGHLNVYGATAISDSLANVLLDRGHQSALIEQLKSAQSPELSPDPRQDVSFGTWAAWIGRNASDPTTLDLEFQQTRGTPEFPSSPVFVALTLPDNSEILAPAIRRGRNVFRALFSDLDSGSLEMLIARLAVRRDGQTIALQQPLSSYRWLAEDNSPFDSKEIPTSTFAQLTVNVDGPGSVLVRWDQPPSRLDNAWLGLFPSQGDLTQLINYSHLGKNAGGVARVAVPAAITPGQYDVRLYEGDDWNLVMSASVEIPGAQPLAEKSGRNDLLIRSNGTLTSPPTAIVGRHLDVQWSGVVSATEGDWIGLFPQNGDLAARLEFVYIAATSDGTISIPIAESVTPGRHDLRLFTNSGSDQVAATTVEVVSAPLPIATGQAHATERDSLVTLSHEFEAGPHAENNLIISWSGISEPSSDYWIGVYAAATDDTQPVNVEGTGGLKSGSVTITLNDDVRPDDVQVRLMRLNSSVLASSAIVRSTPANPAPINGAPHASTSHILQPSVQADSPAISGRNVQVNWSGLTSPSTDNWVGLFPRDGDLSTRLEFSFLTNSASGTVPLPVPDSTSPGVYDVRLFGNGGRDLAAFARLIVVVPKQTLETTNSPIAGRTVGLRWSGIISPHADDWIGLYPEGGAADSRLELVRITATESGLTVFKLPGTLPAGEYELRLYVGGGKRLGTTTKIHIDNASASIRIRQPVIRGGTVEVEWDHTFEPSPSDWLGLFPKGSPASSLLRSEYIAQTESGVTFIPLQSIAMDELEVRMFANGGASEVASASFKTVRRTGSLRATGRGTPGQRISVQWEVTYPSHDDWIGLFPDQGDTSNLLASLETGGTVSGTQSLVIPQNTAPGRYEFRLHSDGDSDVLAIATLTVVAATNQR
jgi:hypothetical protein